MAGRGEDGKEEEGGAEEKETEAEAAANGGGSRPRKTLPRMDPEEALRAFAESVGMPVERMWKHEKRGDGGEIVEIDCGDCGELPPNSSSYTKLTGTLPVGDMHMPYLRILVLNGNSELKGEARGVDVKVVKFTDCFCE